MLDTTTQRRVSNDGTDMATQRSTMIAGDKDTMLYRRRLVVTAT